jgi:hypothetical protein
VLGAFVSASGVGLRDDVTYGSLIASSFQRAYAGDATQAAENFGLFFGLAASESRRRPGQRATSPIRAKAHFLDHGVRRLPRAGGHSGDATGR